jgi:hypothetical protein
MLTTSPGTTRVKIETPDSVSKCVFEAYGRWWASVIYPMDYKTLGPFPTYAEAKSKADEYH